MLGLGQARQVRVNGGGYRTLVAEIDLDLAEVLALLEQMRGIGVAQGVDVGLFGDATGREGKPEGSLQGGAAHWFGGSARAQATVPLGGKEQERMAVRFPLLAQEQERAPGQRDVAILIALAGADVQEHALGIDIADLEPESFTQAQSAGVNGDETDPMIQGRNRRQHPAHFGGGKYDREFKLGIGARQFQFVRPGTVEGFFPEQLDGADGLGAGLAGDPLVRLQMDAILPDIFGREQVRRFGVKLAELAETGVVGLFGARADGQEFQIIGERF